MEVRSQRGVRETSPDRAKICRLKQKVKPFRKVQVVYYLSRNGLLEHPHFMEITLSTNQPLRLKDVFDRLMALRGSGMPLQYSWSSKRNYKSGYVWCDLALQDIVHPSEGGEYVLKGSELVEGCSERFQQLNLSNKEAIHQQTEPEPEPNYGYNTTKSTKALSGGQQQKESEEYEEEYEDGEKTSYTSSTTTPHSRCSRGVSTEEEQDVQNNKTKVVISPPPPPPCNCNSSIAEKLNQRERVKLNSNYPKRLGDGSESAAPSSRYSVLLQLIACGSSGAEFKEKEEVRLSNVGTKRRESVDDKKQKMYSEEDTIINCVSENPRMLLGNLQSEEKEYFSGSIVESIKANRVAFEAEPVLKKSNSYNEERRSRLGMEEVIKGKEREEDKKGGGVKDKCIPLKKSSKESRK